MNFFSQKLDMVLSDVRETSLRNTKLAHDINTARRHIEGLNALNRAYKDQLFNLRTKDVEYLQLDDSALK